MGELEEGEEVVGPKEGVGEGGEEARAVFETGKGVGGRGVVGGGAEEVVGGKDMGARNWGWRQGNLMEIEREQRLQ